MVDPLDWSYISGALYGAFRHVLSFRTKGIRPQTPSDIDRPLQLHYA